MKGRKKAAENLVL